MAELQSWEKPCPQTDCAYFDGDQRQYCGRGCELDYEGCFSKSIETVKCPHCGKQVETGH